MFRDLDIWEIDWGQAGGPAHFPADPAQSPASEFEAAQVKLAALAGGWMSEPELLIMLRLARRLADRARILEIGSCRGRSSSAIAAGIRCASKELFCLDPWRDFSRQGIRAEDPGAGSLPPVDLGILEDFLARTDLLGARLRMLRGTATGFADLLPGRWFDLIFIDGAHEYHNVANDIKLALRLAAPGATVCGHDYRPDCGKAVVRAVSELVFANPAIKEHGVFEGTSIWYGTVDK